MLRSAWLIACLVSASLRVWKAATDLQPQVESLLSLDLGSVLLVPVPDRVMPKAPESEPPAGLDLRTVFLRMDE